MTKRIDKTIFLCGMMGTGKSKVGSRIAEKLMIPFHDLDVLIEAEADMKISDIFETKGEYYFRKLESKILSGFSEQDTGVLALGGGSLQNQFITDHVKNSGILIFIDTPLEILVKRLVKNNKRPMVKNLNQRQMKEKIEQLFTERLPFYKQAHYTIDGSHLNVEEMANKIIDTLIDHDH